jgi:hypothetical protein
LQFAELFGLILFDEGFEKLQMLGFAGKIISSTSRHATCRENSIALSRAAETNNQTKI